MRSWYSVPAVSAALGARVRPDPAALTTPLTDRPPAVNSTFNVLAVPTLIGLLKTTEIAEATATPVAPPGGVVEMTVGAV
jgi:hypothetical protein